MALLCKARFRRIADIGAVPSIGRSGLKAAIHDHALRVIFAET